MTATPAEVKAINGSTAEDPVIEPFIAAAQCILDNVESCTTGKGISSACLDAAQAWLAAHLMAGTPIGNDTLSKKSEKFEGYSVEFIVGNFTGSGVLSTTYGSRANTILDGCLAESDKSPSLVCFFG